MLITEASKPRPVPTDGRCHLCGQVMTLRRMRGHLLGHFGENAGKGAPPRGAAGACLVRITGGSPIRHWLYVRIGPLSTLRSLDALLRDTWLECCGHLSAFKDGSMSYESSMDGIDPDSRKAAPMDVGAARIISRRGSLRYEYDYGTTTELSVEMTSTCPAAGMKPDGVEIVARNSDIPYDCAKCGGAGAAVCLCAYCSWNERGAMMCAPCAKRHRHTWNDDGIGIHLLSVANSPRMGMCAYREYCG